MRVDRSLFGLLCVKEHGKFVRKAQILLIRKHGLKREPLPVAVCLMTDIWDTIFLNGIHISKSKLIIKINCAFIIDERPFTEGFENQCMTVKFLGVGWNGAVVDPLMPFTITVNCTDRPNTITVTASQAVSDTSVDCGIGQFVGSCRSPDSLP